MPGSSVSSVARKCVINPNTIYRWRQKYKGMSCQEAKRLKALEEENSRLKRLLAEKELSMHPRKSLIFWGPTIFNNGHIESYNGTRREELLQREAFETLQDAKVRITEWVREYNTERPPWV